ncbi:hypothetical protein [Rhabdothermincola salaria]|uniref:hypothetical protein n=1 Tax=Rhabdothermincola salaria TaxID=2903142 RepID=UPI001E5B00E1|nr:hypothetical protein [Rhabdothermincola salaria]MCD9622722.1 hypothetical protein [Rhabdothermincola salaria]
MAATTTPPSSATLCPCQCGRYLGPRSLGPARQYPELAELLVAATPALDWIREARVDDPEWIATQASTERFRSNCSQVLRHHLDHLHGTATAGRTPDIASLSRMTVAAADGLREAASVSASMGGPGLVDPRRRPR